MKPRTTDIIVVRQWGAEHQSRGGYWLNWYLANVITGDTPEAIRANVRRYWRGDCLDAYLVPDAETATDIAMTTRARGRRMLGASRRVWRLARIRAATAVRP